MNEHKKINHQTTVKATSLNVTIHSIRNKQKYSCLKHILNNPKSVVKFWDNHLT